MRVLPLVLFLVSATAGAQEAVVLAPGHPDLSLGEVTLESASYVVQLTGDDSQNIGTVEETVTLEGGVLTIVSVSEVQMAGGTTRDSTRFTWPTLAPLSNDVESRGNTGRAVYADGQVSGTYGASMGELPFEFDLRRPVFPSAALPLIVRGIPLTPGYEAVVPTFAATERFKEATLSVVGPEMVTLPDGSEVEAVAIDQTGGGGALAGPFSLRHYVDADTRQLVMTTFQPQPTMTIQVVPMTAEVEAMMAAEAEQEAMAAEAAAGNKLSPGHPDLVAVAPQAIRLAVRVVQPVQQELGFVEMAEVLDGDQLIMTSNVKIQAAGQDQQDTTTVAYPSLAPISRIEIQPTQEERLDVVDGRLVGVAFEDGEEVAVDVEVGDAFGPGITRRLARSLPFVEGYVASFDQLTGSGEISTSIFRVTGQESFTTADGSETMVWVIVEEEEDTPDYFYYVDADTRELLQMAFTPQPGVRVEMTAE